jgi:fatty acid desaturase
MVLGFPALVLLDGRAVLPHAATFALGVFLMNLSFTAWHEPAHGNFSSSGALNVAAGFAASLASFYPGYFARRREHLVHHRFQGIPGKDPAYARIQSSAWAFPIQLLRANYGSPPLDVPASFVPLTPAQRASDALSNAIAVGIIVASVAAGFSPSLLAAWVGPRILVFLLHAYTICFFPHSVPGGGYEVYRVREDGRWLSILTVSQNFHGIHHKWPSIPWHRYRAVLRAARADVEGAGIRIL